MTTRYYKVENSTAMNAWRKFLADRETMLDSAKPLAERFNGKVLSSNSLHDASFAGIALNESPTNPDLWTKPDPKSAGLQRPRKSVPAALKPDLKELTAEWNSLYPEVTRVSKEGLYEALGIDWGDLLFSGGYDIFEYDGALWISIGIKIDGGQELTGSEFDAARKEFKEQPEQKPTPA